MRKLILSLLAIILTQIIHAQIAFTPELLSSYFETKMNDPEQIGLIEGESFPNMGFSDLNGKEVKFDDKNFKLTIANFWFRSCSGCKAENRFLKVLTKHYESDNRIRFVSITPTDPKGIKKFTDKYGDPGFQIISLGSFKKVEELFRFKSYPRQTILDNDGSVLAQYVISVFQQDVLGEYIRRIDDFLKKNKKCTSNLQIQFTPSAYFEVRSVMVFLSAIDQCLTPYCPSGNFIKIVKS